MPNTDLDQQVRAQLFQLLTGLLPLRDFQIWFAPVAWRLGRAENRDRFPLSRRVELRLAEYTNGHWSEADVMREMDALLRPAQVTMGVGRGDTIRHVGPIDAWYGGVPTKAGV